MTISFIKTFFSLAILLFCLLQAKQVHAKFKIIAQYKIVIANGLPSGSPPLTAHCQSKDDDIGHHTLNPDQSFNWEFGMNAFATTRFYCSFTWGQKIRSCDVFNANLADRYCGSSIEVENICYWLVKEDGFYLSARDDPQPSDLHLINKW